MKGLAITTIGALILAVVALILLWFFVSGTISIAQNGAKDAVSSIISALCTHVIGAVGTGFAQSIGLCK